MMLAIHIDEAPGEALLERLARGVMIADVVPSLFRVMDVHRRPGDVQVAEPDHADRAGMKCRSK